VESWIAPLLAGRPEAAWDLFIDRYRRLIFAAIRRYTTDPDDVMDVFAHVCEQLRENDFGRLRRYAAQSDSTRKFSTWLCAVIHNLTIDWIRHRNGRPRLSAVAATLGPLRQRLFQYVFVQQHSHVEAYELLRSRDAPALTFTEFLKELRATYRAAGSTQRGPLVQALAAIPPDPPAETPDADPAMLVQRQAVLAEAMQELSDEDRVAVQLYVVEGIPAEQVARALGLPGAKSVYSRVYRALASLRGHLERIGISAGDL
jgi:RNA polymerase sigma factor (sigma-70 family)